MTLAATWDKRGFEGEDVCSSLTVWGGNNARLFTWEQFCTCRTTILEVGNRIRSSYKCHAVKSQCSIFFFFLIIQGLAAFLKAIGYLIPLMDAEYANYYTREVMLILIREFPSPDEEMKKIVLKVSIVNFVGCLCMLCLILDVQNITEINMHKVDI